MISRKIVRGAITFFIISLLAMPQFSLCTKPGYVARFFAIFTNNCITRKIFRTSKRKQSNLKRIPSPTIKVTSPEGEEVPVNFETPAPKIKVKTGFIAWCKGLLGFARVRGLIKRIFTRKAKIAMVTKEKEKIERETEVPTNNTEEKQKKIEELLQKNEELKHLYHSEKENLIHQLKQIKQQHEENLTTLRSSYGGSLSEKDQKIIDLEDRCRKQDSDINKKILELTDVRKELTKLTTENERLKVEIQKLNNEKSLNATKLSIEIQKVEDAIEENVKKQIRNGNHKDEKYKDIIKKLQDTNKKNNEKVDDLENEFKKLKHIKEENKELKKKLENQTEDSHNN